MKKIIFLIVFAVVLPCVASAEAYEDFDIAIECHGIEPCSTEHRLDKWTFPKVFYACLFIENFCQSNADPLCQARNFNRNCADMLKAFHDETNKTP
jgi:hypothetical protein